MSKMRDHAQRFCVVCGGKIVETKLSESDKHLILGSTGEKVKSSTDCKCEACGLKYDLPVDSRQILKG